MAEDMESGSPERHPVLPTSLSCPEWSGSGQEKAVVGQSFSCLGGRALGTCFHIYVVCVALLSCTQQWL